jgi:translation initiation factor eIF-2B subunit alpha
LEGRPDAAGVKAARAYASHSANIPTTVVLDSALGYIMEKVDIVLVGAEAIVENGGCVNKMGTYALAACAKAHGKPFYVAAESYKFARLYPLNQQDLSTILMGDTNTTTNTEASTATTLTTHHKATPPTIQFVDTTTTTTSSSTPSLFSSIALPDTVKVENSPCDFTPAKFITLLFTDLGVLTPSAVSDELIRLYQ